MRFVVPDLEIMKLSLFAMFWVLTVLHIPPMNILDKFIIIRLNPIRTTLTTLWACQLKIVRLSNNVNLNSAHYLNSWIYALSTNLIVPINMGYVSPVKVKTILMQKPQYTNFECPNTKHHHISCLGTPLSENF